MLIVTGVSITEILIYMLHYDNQKIKVFIILYNTLRGFF